MNKIIILLALGLIASGCAAPPPIIWKRIETSLQTQLITARDGDIIQLEEGHFIFSKSLLLDGKSNIILRGKGKDKTILSFLGQTEGAQGLLVTNGKNITLENFSVEDAKGDNIKVSDVIYITLRGIRSSWTGEPSNKNGAYALYPVLCKHVLMEECEAIGSSDAGIYVGQSDSVIIRNNKAYWNVAGIESENSSWVEIYGNEAYENTGGLLVFDLPGLTQYGHHTHVYKNNLHDNNHENFATPGNVVASIPPGTGMLILATHDLDMSDNDITDNKSIGTGVISYELVAAINDEEIKELNSGSQRVNNNYKMDTLYNPYPYRINIHDNRYKNSHWFPSLNNDIGKLFLFKSFLSPPDIVYDGIKPKKDEPQICVHDNGNALFFDLDAANEFKAFTKDASAYRCQ